jgi:hypothetical protein
MSGTTGEEPVATTKRRARISFSPWPVTTTVRSSLKRASPRRTSTPSPVKR